MRNNVGVFLKYLRDAGLANLQLPGLEPASRNKVAAVGRLKALLEQIDDVEACSDLELLESIISTAFGIRREALSRGQWYVTDSGQSLNLTDGRQQHAAPAELRLVVSRWWRLRGSSST
jgi:hypothetical protein